MQAQDRAKQFDGWVQQAAQQNQTADRTQSGGSDPGSPDASAASPDAQARADQFDQWVKQAASANNAQPDPNTRAASRPPTVASAGQQQPDATAQARADQFDRWVADAAGTSPSSPPSSSGGALATAQAQEGKPYLWGGSTDPNQGLDCSGLVQYAYGQNGFKLPRTADQQYAATDRVDAQDLQPGDLVFFKDTGGESGITHVGIYQGNGQFVDAPDVGQKIRVDNLNSPYWAQHFAGGGRVRGFQVVSQTDPGSPGAGAATSAATGGDAIDQGIASANPNLVQMAVATAQRYGIDARTFLRQVYQESRFDPNARNPNSGAEGLGQLMPQFYQNVDRFNPQANLNAAAQTMAGYLKSYGGDWNKALIAYNAGPGGLQKFLQTGQLPAETQTYVKNILGTVGSVAGGLLSKGGSPAAAPPLPAGSGSNLYQPHDTLADVQQNPAPMVGAPPFAPNVPTDISIAPLPSATDPGSPESSAVAPLAATNALAPLGPTAATPNLIAPFDKGSNLASPGTAPSPTATTAPAWYESMREGASHSGLYLPPFPGSQPDLTNEQRLQQQAESNRTRPGIGPGGLSLFNPNLNPEPVKSSLNSGEAGEAAGEIVGQVPGVGGLLKMATGGEHDGATTGAAGELAEAGPGDRPAIAAATARLHALLRQFESAPAGSPEEAALRAQMTDAADELDRLQGLGTSAGRIPPAERPEAPVGVAIPAARPTPAESPLIAGPTAGGSQSQLASQQALTSAPSAAGGLATKGGQPALFNLPPLDTTAAATQSALGQALQRFGPTADYQAFESAWRLAANDPVARYKLLAAIQKPDYLHTAIAATYGNVLSGPSTLGLVALHSGIQALQWPVLNFIRGNPADTLHYVAAMGGAMGKALPAAIHAFLDGIGESGATEALVNHPEDLKASALLGPKGIPLSPASRLMAGLHELYYQLGYAGSLAVSALDEARTTGRSIQDILANPSPELADKAAKMAQDAVHGGTPSAIGQALLGLERKAGQGNSVAEKVGNTTASVLMQTLVPFVQIPDYYFRNAAKIGTAPVYYGATTLAHAARGEWGKAASDMRMWGVTSAITYGLFSLALGGAITGSGPSDPNKLRLLQGARNPDGSPMWVANSFRVGNRWVSDSAAGPLGGAMAAIASAVEAASMDGKPPSNLKELAQVSAGAVGRSVLDTQYLRNVAMIVSDIQNGNAVGAGQSVATMAAERLVPQGAALAQIAQLQSGGVSKAPENIPQALEARIPGLNQSVPDQVSPYGESKAQPVDAASLLPGRAPAPGEYDPVAAEVARLIRAGQVVPIRQFSATQQERGGTFQGSAQSPAQIRALQASIGQQAHTALAQLIARPDYQALSDADKAASIKRALAAADKQGTLLAEEGQVNTLNPVTPAMDAQHQAALAWAQTPHYRGVDLNAAPEEIAQQNLQIQQAKAMLADYQKKYGTREGKMRFYDDHPDLYDLARFQPLNARYLKQERDAIDQQYNGALTQALNSGLIDAGDVLNNP